MKRLGIKSPKSINACHVLMELFDEKYIPTMRILRQGIKKRGSLNLWKYQEHIHAAPFCRKGEILGLFLFTLSGLFGCSFFGSRFFSSCLFSGCFFGGRFFRGSFFLCCWHGILPKMVYFNRPLPRILEEIEYYHKTSCACGIIIYNILSIYHHPSEESEE